jgi:hypothetical protein
MASRMSSTRPPNLSAFWTLLKNPLTVPCAASGSSPWSDFSSFLKAPLLDRTRLWTVQAYCSNFFLLSCSLESPPETGAQSEAERTLTLGANDSIACRFAFVRWNTREPYRRCASARGHTSQLSRIKQRPPATDLRGLKTSAESLTPRSNSLAVADAVDFQSDFFPSVVFGSPSSGCETSWPGFGMAEVTTFVGGTVRNGMIRGTPFAYRHRRARSMAKMLADRPEQPFCRYLPSSPC